jgi:energy-coupling factor transporter ATP-binding protein EcfA2
MIQTAASGVNQPRPVTIGARRTMVELSSVTVAYGGRVALEGLSLRMREGEAVLITGPTGCGKSTLALVLSGLIPHAQEARFSGRVSVNGMDTRAHPLHRLSTQAGVVFQNPSTQLFHTTVEEEVAFAPRNIGLPEEEIRLRTSYALQSVSIGHLRGRSTRSLSMGEKQRLAIASTLSLKPRLLILDEPTANLDRSGVEQVAAALKRLNEEQGVTVVIFEHRLAAFVSWVDRLMILECGRLVVDSPPGDPAIRPRLDRLGLAAPATQGDGASWSSLRWASLPDRRQETPVVRMEGIEAGYGRTVCLGAADLALYPGELTALVGPNGAGKSTLARVLTGTLRPRRGRVRWNRGLKGLALGRRVGFLHHNVAAQLFMDTVREEVAFAPRNFKLPLDPLVERSLSVNDLQGLSERLPSSLSVGEQQRAALAAILSADPRLLVLDEPTVGQDWIHLSALMEYLAGLRSAGKSVLVITHDERLVRRYADRLVHLLDGRIAADLECQPIRVRRSREGTVR